MNKMVKVWRSDQSREHGEIWYIANRLTLTYAVGTKRGDWYLVEMPTGEWDAIRVLAGVGFAQYYYLAVGDVPKGR